MATHYGSDLFTEGQVYGVSTVSTVATAGAVTYTAAQIKGRLILRDPAGAARADLFPTAAALFASFEDAPVGLSFEVQITNTADQAETITMTTNTGLTLTGTMTIAQNASRRFLVRIDSATAVSIYSAASFTT